MTAQTMKIPANGATRLSKECWVNAEILMRAMGAGSVRKAIEAIVDEAVTKRLDDPDFVKVVQEVKMEGIDDD